MRRIRSFMEKNSRKGKLERVRKYQESRDTWIKSIDGTDEVGDSETPDCLHVGPPSEEIPTPEAYNEFVTSICGYCEFADGCRWHIDQYPEEEVDFY